MKINSQPIVNSYWVITGRFRAGEYPGSNQDEETRKKLRWLLDQGTNLMLDLTEVGETGMKPYSHLLYEEADKIQMPVRYKRLPIPDFTIPSHDMMEEILNFLDLSLIERKNIYIHCLGGQGRTGTVVGCYLVRHGMAGDLALAMIKEFRKGIPGKHEQSPETEGQRKMVMEWSKGQ